VPSCSLEEHPCAAYWDFSDSLREKRLGDFLEFIVGSLLVGYDDELR
jgi:hypothetical protein